MPNAKKAKLHKATKDLARVKAPEGQERVPQKHGGALLKGGVKGNAGGGRAPGTWKAFLVEVRNAGKVRDEFEAAVSDRTSKGYAAALRVLTDYDPDKPAEKRELSGKVEVTVNVQREGKRRTAS